VKLQKQKTREVRGKEYYRWVVVLPHNQLERLKWVEGEELEAETKGEYLILRRKEK
jgi:hypothetical protein